MSEDPRLAKLREIDELLAAKGWPKISPWWWNVIEQFYATGKWCGGQRFECVIEGGRRGGKSATIAGKIAAAEILTTVVDEKGVEQPFHKIPPNDVGYFGMISAEKDQAKARLATTKKALQALGCSFSVANTTELVVSGTNLGVMAITASLSGVVSFTCIGALLDEMALWEDETGANPALEVVKSLKPTRATVPYSMLWYVSAPWAEEGVHYDMVKAGNDETQIVFHGATWEMNPTLTRADTRLMEKDYVSWLRAYGAVPMKTDESKFFPAVFLRAAAGERVSITEHDIEGTELEIGSSIEPVKVKGKASRTTSGGDMAFRRNSAAMVVMSKVGERLRYVTSKELMPGVVPLRPTKTIKDLAKTASVAGADCMACDLHYIETVREVLEDLELPLIEFVTKADDIEAAYVRVRVLLSEGGIDLTEAPEQLLEQLKATTQKPNTTGLGISNPTKGNRHGDLVSAFVCAIWAIDQVVELQGDVTTGGRRFGRGEEPKDDGWDGWP